MQKQIKTKLRFRIIVFSILLISIISISGLVVYAMQSFSVPVEVIEPLEIVDYPTGFSLYPGETVNFDFTVENLASVTYFQEFEFLVNDTTFQTYVTFSNYNYSIPPGIHKLDAWLTIAPNAPARNFVLTISKKTDAPIPISNLFISSDVKLTPTLELLAGGARWAAQEGKSALYISWRANYDAHHTSNGVDWEYSKDSYMTYWDWEESIVAALETQDFDITIVGDFPNDLSEYDVVVIFAYYALEPNMEPLIRKYIQAGGSVVLIGATPSYLVAYSKSLGCSNNIESIADWFGASRYRNGGGSISVVVDNPLGTSFSLNEHIFVGSGISAAAIGSLSSDSKAIALYDTGGVVAFTHEYGDGRVYYQAYFQRLP
jgi:hypothetical protein